MTIYILDEEDAFHVALIPIGKAWKIFSLLLSINSKQDKIFYPWYANLSRRRKILTLNLLNSAKKIDVESLQDRVERLLNAYTYMHIYTGWNDKIVVLKKTTLQLYFKTFIENNQFR